MRQEKTRPGEGAGSDRVGTGSNDQDTSSAAAERALTGCVVTPPAPDLLADVLDRLRDDDILDGRYRFIVSTVRRMVAEQIPPHPLVVAEYVESRGLLTAAAPRMSLRLLLADLVADAPPAVMVGWFADRVIEHAARRRLVATAAELARLATGADITDLAEQIQVELLAVLDHLDRCTPREVTA